MGANVAPDPTSGGASNGKAAAPEPQVQAGLSEQVAARPFMDAVPLYMAALPLFMATVPLFMAALLLLCMAMVHASRA
eukprot:3810088-Rhodomonas_salina.2